jgi:hypothetical protein
MGGVGASLPMMKGMEGEREKVDSLMLLVN